MIAINPGSGPVHNHTDGHALTNIVAFVKDLSLPGIVVDESTTPPDGGRYRFTLTANGRSVDIGMPGVPLERVRYIDGPEQNIWHFPRLYVDGSSWVWFFALSAADDALTLGGGQ